MPGTEIDWSPYWQDQQKNANEAFLEILADGVNFDLAVAGGEYAKKKRLSTETNLQFLRRIVSVENGSASSSLYTQDKRAAISKLLTLLGQDDCKSSDAFFEYLEKIEKLFLNLPVNLEARCKLLVAKLEEGRASFEKFSNDVQANIDYKVIPQSFEVIVYGEPLNPSIVTPSNTKKITDAIIIEGGEALFVGADIDLVKRHLSVATRESADQERINAIEKIKTAFVKDKSKASIATALDVASGNLISAKKDEKARPSYQSTKLEIEKNIAKLYGLPVKENNESIIPDLSKYAKNYYFWPSTKQRAAQHYIDVDSKFDNIITRCAKSASDYKKKSYVEFHQRMASLEDNLSDQSYSLIEQSTHLSDVKRALINLYALSDNNAQDTDLVKLQKGFSFIEKFGAEYQAAIKLFKMTEQIPADKQAISAQTQILCAYWHAKPSLKTDITKQSLLNRLEASSKDVWTHRAIQSVANQEGRVETQKKEIATLAENFHKTSEKGCPFGVSNQAVIDDYYLPLIFPKILREVQNRRTGAVEQVQVDFLSRKSMKNQFAKLKIESAQFFIKEKPNHYFALMLSSLMVLYLDITLAEPTAEEKRFKQALKELVQVLVSGGDYSGAYKNLSEMPIAATFLLKYLPNQLELNAKASYSSRSGLDKIIVSDSKEQNRIDALSDDQLVSEIERQSQVIQKRALGLSNGLAHFIASHPKQEGSGASNSVFLVYTLLLWYSEKGGIKDYYNKNSNDLSSDWRTFIMQYKAMLDVLDSVIKGIYSINEMVLIIPDEHPYKSNNSPEGSTSLDKLFAIIRGIFSDTGMVLSSAEEDPKSNVSREGSDSDQIQFDAVECSEYDGFSEGQLLTADNQNSSQIQDKSDRAVGDGGSFSSAGQSLNGPAKSLWGSFFSREHGKNQPYDVVSDADADAKVSNTVVAGQKH